MDADIAVLAMFALACAVVVLSMRIRRRHVRALTAEGAFRCRVRASGAGDGTRAWTRRTIEARWVHDVLVLDWGIIHRKRRALGIRTAFGVLEATRTWTTDEGEVSLCFELDDGSTIRVTTSEGAAEALGGPFLTAHPAVRQTPPRV
jgi:hypothetical protein